MTALMTPHYRHHHRTYLHPPPPPFPLVLLPATSMRHSGYYLLNPNHIVDGYKSLLWYLVYGPMGRSMEKSMA